MGRERFLGFIGNPQLREAIEFYKHAPWMEQSAYCWRQPSGQNSMLEKEGMAGHVQIVYFDPPYGIRYGSNFQPFVNKREVKDDKDEGLTSEPEDSFTRNTGSRPLHLVVRGRRRHLQQLAAPFASVTVVDADAYVTKYRQRAVHNASFQIPSSARSMADANHLLGPVNDWRFAQLYRGTLVYSCFAAFRIGRSVSASFHNIRKSW